MDKQEFVAVMTSITDALMDINAAHMANSYILFEITRDMACFMPDRDKYLASLFERVHARADQSSLNHETKPLVIAFRKQVDVFFEMIAKSPR